ncbi:uncharacterized protein N7482_002907 [Penicillium canariense]|uniref:histidine kinase n=1 Tax=Penicillium canariense TaxID=189055 RepID=A0A9W9IH10_9EURO|nr:uncharacterized protein N7482_002907 [Penicillium canariense]KAJ5177030.1 hypothetical protein N7482_002907 [Penicillium canariense]
MTPGPTGEGHDAGPRRYAYNIDAAREREMHLYESIPLLRGLTNDPGRVLSEPKDLTYMAAFSNTVMAEVSRMDLQAADRAKSDFISSISHELRSPLHGVLGTVELLQETATTFTQRGLVDTVYSCGRTLLDTLNHLLDYSKINTLTATRGPGQEGPEDGSSGARVAVPGLVQDEDLSVLVQEGVEGLLAGAEFYNRETDTAPERTRQDGSKSSPSARMGDKDRRLMTIVDVEWQDNWHYPVYAGAWRRVVMNLFGNALKYTQSGYIRLFMKKTTSTTRDGKSSPAVCITISDSGRGMSQDFLLHHLYIPFLQEDIQLPGLGVGLHLVHQIVKSLDGKIGFKSELGQGTHVGVVLPIPGPQAAPSLHSPYVSLRERLKGMTVSFFTQTFARGDLGIRQEVFDEIRSTMSRMVTDWFQVRVLSPDELQQQTPDFLIVTEHEYRTLAQKSSHSDVQGLINSESSFPLIVLSAQTSSWKVVKENNKDRAIFLSQPVSPKTLATVFQHCLGHPREADNPASETNGQPSPSSPEENSIEMANEEDRRTRRTVSQVLLVEDNGVNLKIIETCVKNAGLDYQSTTNGRDALEKFKAERFDAVVMDISMPVMDGLTATRKMRHFEKTNDLRRTPIIILTAVLSADMQQEAEVSDVDKFLTKPTPLKQLKELLQNLPQIGGNPRNAITSVHDIGSICPYHIKQSTFQTSSIRLLITAMASGSCACRYIRYTTTIPPTQLVHCHCVECRKQAGAPYISWVDFPTDSITWTVEPTAWRASNVASRTFCPRCGSTMTMTFDNDPSSTAVAAGTLDAESEQLVPMPGKHIFFKEKAAWYVVPDDGAKKYDEWTE